MSEVKQPQKIKISEVQTLLKQGFTRSRKDDLGYGSIEAHFGISPKAVASMFQHPKLKGLKTITPEYVLIDDTDEIIVETDEQPPLVQAPTPAIEAEIQAPTSSPVPAPAKQETVPAFF